MAVQQTGLVNKGREPYTFVMTKIPDHSRPEQETGIGLKTRLQTKQPSYYKVLLLNDDYTPMDFVVLVLEKFFNKDQTQAVEVMMSVHKTGVGLCGVYTYEVAETKVVQVLTFAREHQHPLQCTMEKD